MKIRVNSYGTGAFYCDLEMQSLGAPRVTSRIEDGVGEIDAKGETLAVRGRHDRLVVTLDAREAADRRALALNLRECADKLDASAANREAFLETEAAKASDSL